MYKRMCISFPKHASAERRGNLDEVKKGERAAAAHAAPSIVASVDHVIPMTINEKIWQKDTGN